MERLGYGRGGIHEIKKHTWFEGFNWDGMKDTKLKAPYSPKVSQWFIKYQIKFTSKSTHSYQYIRWKSGTDRQTDRQTDTYTHAHIYMDKRWNESQANCNDNSTWTLLFIIYSSETSFQSTESAFVKKILFIEKVSVLVTNENGKLYPLNIYKVIKIADFGICVQAPTDGTLLIFNF